MLKKTDDKPALSQGALVVSAKQSTVPARRRDTLLGPIRNGYLARSFRAETIKVDAETAFVYAIGRLADAKLDTARRVDTLRDLNAILDDDQAERDHQRNLSQVRRDTELAAAKAETQRAEEQHYRARDSRKFSMLVRPLLRRRGLDMAKTGNIDALKQLQLAQDEHHGPPVSETRTGVPDFLSGLERAKTTLMNQLERARARSLDTAELEMAIGRLEADIQQARSQPG